ncbi:MAG: extracellular solute-binding protein [Chloroflexota bacterium]
MSEERTMVGRSVSRRVVLRMGAALASLPIAAACGQSAAPAAPAKPAESKPAEAAKPAESKPAEAAKPAESKPAAAAPAAKKAGGKLSVLQAKDFHPEHHPFIEKKIREFAEQGGYQLEHAYTEAFAGGGNVVQKLTASVQAGDAPDAMTHTLQPSELKFLDLVQDVKALQADISKDFGAVSPGLMRRAELDGKVLAVHHFSRSGAWWVRETPLKEAGLDIKKDFADFPSAREAALKASKPDKESWGWGMTTNRSGDGNTIVRTFVQMWGAQLVDEAGQVVVLNKDPYRELAIAGLTFLKETYTDPKWSRMLPPGVNAWNDTGNNEAYLAGKIFFTNNAGTLLAKAVLDKNPVADDTYLIPTPKGAGSAGRTMDGVDGNRWFVLTGSKNRDGGDALIKFMLSKDIQNEVFRISTGYAYPAYEKGWDDKVITESPIAKRVTPVWQAQVLAKTTFTGDEFPAPPNSAVAALVTGNLWTDMFGEIMAGKAIPDALKSAHDRAVKVFKEYGLKGE